MDVASDLVSAAQSLDSFRGSSDFVGLLVSIQESIAGYCIGCLDRGSFLDVSVVLDQDQRIVDR